MVRSLRRLIARLELRCHALYPPISRCRRLLNPGLRYRIESRASLPIQPEKQRHIRQMINEVRHFPARLMTLDEQALAADWLATAGDIALAYISKRGNDDPNLHRRIVIKAGTDNAPSHIVYAASGRDIWFVFEPGRRARIRRFRTLRTALNSIRPGTRGSRRRCTRQVRQGTEEYFGSASSSDHLTRLRLARG